MDYHSLGSMCVPFPYRVSYFFLLSASEYSVFMCVCVCVWVSLSLPPSFSFYNSLSFAFVITSSKKRFFRPIEKSNSVIENAVEIRGTLNLNESIVHRLKWKMQKTICVHIICIRICIHTYVYILYVYIYRIYIYM